MAPGHRPTDEINRAVLSPALPENPRMQSLLSLALAASEDQPLIDIDYTVFVQLALFLLVMWFLTAAVFRPYLRLREARGAGMEGARAEAKTMQQEAQKKLADYEQRLVAARKRGAEERARLRAEGTDREQQVLAAARAETARALEASRTRLHTEGARVQAEMQPRIREIAGTIARKLLGREV
jgi:F-type H+-transporting ATPase subunit b